eukprot:4159407-Lingulodinium_polyedra.AAC.1
MGAGGHGLDRETSLSALSMERSPAAGHCPQSARPDLPERQASTAGKRGATQSPERRRRPSARL